ncbi:hypothetical protein LAC02_46640 [Ligilactobacillus acidipiscis]|nr:hypothetical protein LAC02_46640 [Ligilactobacillus acidipiscis]
MKKALTPIPGVMIIGASAIKYISKHPSAEEKIVAKTLKEAGIPASFKMRGFTTMI